MHIKNRISVLISNIDESEKDVLEDIRDNTTETNDKLDNLTDGFQNDGMDSSKDELNSSLAGIDNAENSLFNPAINSKANTIMDMVCTTKPITAPTKSTM